MSVGSDNGKCIASHVEGGGRSKLGKIIKGKLEQSGYLKHKERVTPWVLENYGRGSLKFIKYDDENYEIVF